MRRVVVLSGISGSGKSTLARKLWNDLEPGTYCKVVSADDYFMREGKYEFNPSLLGDAHGACFRDYIATVSKGTPEYDLVIVDNTNLSVAEIAPYMLGAQAYGWEAEVMTLQIPTVYAHMRNVHGVGADAVERQFNALTNRSLPPWWKNTFVAADGYKVATVSPVV